MTYSKTSIQNPFVLSMALLLTIGICLIKAGALPWVSLAWSSLTMITLAVVITINLINIDSKPSPSLGNTFKVPLAIKLFFIFQCWCLFQFFTISYDKPASLDQALIGLGMLSLLLIWRVALNHKSALKWLYLSIIICALAQSAYGLWVYLNDIDLLLWMPKMHYLDRPTGFFVNANHFAAYLVMSIILCISKMITTPNKHIKRNIVIRALDQFHNPNNLIVVLLLITLIASKSAGAIVSLCITLGLLSIIIARKTNNLRIFFFGIILLLFIIATIVLSLDYSTVEGQISDLSHTIARRIALSKAAFSMLQDHWLLGIGGGSFYSQFSAYRTLEIGNSYYRYAHNDIIQFWIEYGIIGVLSLLAFLTIVLRDNIRVLRQPHTGIQATFAYTSIYCTLAICLHSLVDFPLHIPGFSVCYLVIISINSLALNNPKHQHD